MWTHGARRSSATDQPTEPVPEQGAEKGSSVHGREPTHGWCRLGAMSMKIVEGLELNPQVFHEQVGSLRHVDRRRIYERAEAPPEVDKELVRIEKNNQTVLRKLRDLMKEIPPKPPGLDPKAGKTLIRRVHKHLETVVKLLQKASDAAMKQSPPNKREVARVENTMKKLKDFLRDPTASKWTKEIRTNHVPRGQVEGTPEYVLNRFWPMAQEADDLIRTIRFRIWEKR